MMNEMATMAIPNIRAITASPSNISGRRIIFISSPSLNVSVTIFVAFA